MGRRLLFFVKSKRFAAPVGKANLARLEKNRQSSTLHCSHCLQVPRRDGSTPFGPRTRWGYSWSSEVWGKRTQNRCMPEFPKALPVHWTIIVAL